MTFLLGTDHISILERGVGPEFTRLTTRMATYPVHDFGYSSVSLHEQVVGANAFINRAKQTADVIRGYAILERIF